MALAEPVYQQSEQYVAASSCGVCVIWLIYIAYADGRLALLRSASAGSAGSGNASCVPPRCDTCFGDGGAPQGPYFPLWGASTILLLLLPPHRGTVLAAYLHH